MRVQISGTALITTLLAAVLGAGAGALTAVVVVASRPPAVGPAGPQGLQGPIGPRGPAGAQGLPGLPGSAGRDGIDAQSQQIIGCPVPRVDSIQVPFVVGGQLISWSSERVVVC